MVAKLLAAINIAEVHFYSRNSHSCKPIANGDAGVGVCPSINQNTVMLAPSGMYGVNQNPFMIRLKEVYLNSKPFTLIFEAMVDAI